MSRKSGQSTFTTTSFTLSGSSLASRTNNSSLPAGESLSLKNPYVLHEHVPSQTSHSKRHRRESSRLGPGSVGGSGKDGRSGKTGASGGIQDETDSSESSGGQDDEETDGDDDDDGDDADEPAVDGPVRVNEHAASMELFPGDRLVTEDFSLSSTIANGDHRTGQDSRKRVFNADIDEDGDGQDYPRRKVARFASNDDSLTGFSAAIPGLVGHDMGGGCGGNKEGGAYLGLAGEEDEDEEDEDIEKEEEAAIIQEFEDDTEPETPVPPSSKDTLDIIRHLDFTSGDELEDLNDEVFTTQWNDPGFFTDIPCDPMGEFSMFHGDDPFSANPGRASTPVVTPDNIPQAPPPAAPPSAPVSPGERRASSSSTLSSEFGENDDVSDVNPSPGRKDPLPKHLEDTQGRGEWDDGKSGGGDPFWGSFFSSGESGEESDDEDGTEESGGGEADADEGETTDEEENLPMPTPQSKSILRRVSFAPDEPQSPQVVHMDGASRPRLGSWVADPSRPICVVDGPKKTYLVPKGQRLSIGADSNNGSISNLMVMMEEESESEHSSILVDYDPTLGGLTGGSDLFFNGGDILGPPEAFYPYFNENGELVGDGLLPEDDLDEFEVGLQITDFLELSSDGEEETDFNKTCLEILGGAGGEAGEEESVPPVDSSAEMLSRWDKVSVTAFRKRQHHGDPSSGTTPGHGFHKMKEGRLAEPVTPVRKKSKRKYHTGNRGLRASAAMRKKISSKRS